MKVADRELMYSHLPKKRKRKPRKTPPKRHSRRIKRVDVNPPEIYQSVTSASAYTGVSVTSLLRRLDTGVFCGGIWESIDPPRKGTKIKADGVIYRSIVQAAGAIKISRSSFSRQIGQGLKEFTLKGHSIEILE
jgi:hypothetical protein